MKKIYIQPASAVYNVETQSFVATSPTQQIQSSDNNEYIDNLSIDTEGNDKVTDQYSVW